MKVTLHTQLGFSGEYTKSVSSAFTTNFDGITLENGKNNGDDVVTLSIQGEDMYVMGDLSVDEVDDLISVLMALQTKIGYGTTNIHEQ